MLIKNQKEDLLLKNNTLAGLLLLSIFWPAFAFALAAGKLWRKQYHIIILIFSFWFGYYINFYSGDIISYKQTYEMVEEYTWSDFYFLIENFHTTGRLKHYQGNTVNSKPDIYALTLQFLFSRVSDNSRWFFGFVSLLYTFFFLKFLDEVLLITKKTFTKSWYVFFWSLVLLIPFYRTC